MLECKTVDTPMEKNPNLVKCESWDLDIPYQQFIGDLIYLSFMTRPDISHCISYLSQFNNCHDKTNFQALMRNLRYLQKPKIIIPNMRKI